jgi:uncharacterized delta-60 repeat protein
MKALLTVGKARSNRALLPARSAFAIVAAAIMIAAGCFPNPRVSAQSGGTQGGALDTTFGNAGQVTTDFFGGTDQGSFVLIQSDSKILTGGSAVDASGNMDFALARYNPDGSLDSTFGTNGKVTTNFFGEDATLTRFALQTDNKIVACGWVQMGNNLGSADFALARYNTDGSLDSTFGTGGKVTTDFFGSADQTFGVAIQSDGRIVVCGRAEIPAAQDISDLALARYNTDGSLDSTFGSDGKVTTQTPGMNANGFDVAIQSDNMIVVGGDADNSSSTAGMFLVLRYGPDGTLDPTFGTGGQVTTNINGNVSEILAMGLQQDGKIVGVGFTNGPNPDTNPTDDFAIARYDTNGSLDTTFGTNGTVVTDFFGNSDKALGLAFQADGKLIVTGFATVPSTLQQTFVVVRYNTDGSLDQTFGTGGKVTTAWAGNNDRANAPAVQSDGNIVVVGTATEPTTGQDFALARYLPGTPAPPPEPDFTLAFAQPTVSTKPGTKITAQADITPVDGFTGKVTITPPVTTVKGLKLPTAAVTTSADSVNFKIKVKVSVKAGSYPVTFTGMDSTGKLVHTATLTIVVQ